ncbi:amidase [Pseudomonas matsuisoli]|uniref:Amidase n=2 Tax=Pseudomonas matsuisoli TaxID=1515666 RepID=A0A917PZ48_9PSED|nr:amidase [Pseudomonas matsuisoli]
MARYMVDSLDMRAGQISTLAGRLADGRASSEALITKAVRAIDAHRAEGGVAYVSVDVKGALSLAQESDRMRNAGFVPSSLAGLPISVTDAFDMAGCVTGAASKVRSSSSPAVIDALVVARLRNAGAILLGRTNMSEFALSCLGTNSHYGTPTLPMDRCRVVGGSGSGLAVSVATKMAVAGVGADTQGSIRIPAAFCGLVGFKPSANRVSTRGLYPLSPTLDSIGSIARYVDDCVILDAIMSGERGEVGGRPLKGLRLAVTSDYVLDALDENVEYAFKRALQLLTDAGATLVWFDFPELASLGRISDTGDFVAVEAWYHHRQNAQAAALECYDPVVLKRLRQGESLSAYDYLDLLAERQRLIQVARARLMDVDAWLMPTVPMSAPRLDELGSGEPCANYFEREARARRNTSLVNFLDGCALTLPCQEHKELPVGLSIVGLNGMDADVLKIGRSVEALLRASRAAVAKEPVAPREERRDRRVAK